MVQTEFSKSQATSRGNRYFRGNFGGRGRTPNQTRHGSFHRDGEYAEPRRRMPQQDKGMLRSNREPLEEKSKTNLHRGEETEWSDGSSSSDASVIPPCTEDPIFFQCPLPSCAEAPVVCDSVALALAHLEERHKLTIHAPQQVVWVLEDYLRTLFDRKLLDMDKPDIGVVGKDRYEVEDKLIRKTLQQEQLTRILKIQEQERNGDATVPRKCLFCKVVPDNRQVLFKHMYNEHSFNIGLPDNLVNVNEFLNLLETKLESLQCLYCEKIFKSPTVLRKHMRKKKHFKINGRNRTYDRFYVVNYLEPGKGWETIEKEFGNDSEEEKNGGKEAEEWSDWEEDDSDQTLCLFDGFQAKSPHDACLHMKEKHRFDIQLIKKELKLDFYQCIKLINFIRHQTKLRQCIYCGLTSEDLETLNEHMSNEDHFRIPLPESGDTSDAPWNDTRFLVPIYEDDPLLRGFDGSFDEEDVDPQSQLAANQKLMQEIPVIAESFKDKMTLYEKSP